MQIEAFRIHAGEGIRDTGWVAWDTRSTYLEKHKVDAPRILRALATIRPATPDDAALLRELENSPHRGDGPIVTVRFRLKREERRTLVTQCPSLRAATCVEVSRLYSGELQVR